jgi:hypothetical protein
MEGLIRETSLDGLSRVRYDGACSVEVAEYKRLQQMEYTVGVTSVQAHGSFNDAVNCYVT